MGIFNLFKPSKNMKNDNGPNEFYYDKGKGNLRLRFNKINGKIDGLFEIYALNGRTACLIANFKEGKLHGECKEYSPSGGCFRRIEKWENNELKSWESFFTASSKRGQLANKWEGNVKTSYLKEDIEKELKKYTIKNR
tara:strand:+ start:817 stop:1230 length:414 start_codon:yes stop_codon:yes gene_type:complete